MVTDYIVEIGLEAIKNKTISIENRKVLGKRLKNFVEQQSHINMNCTLEEEIDFANLSRYICNILPKELESCLFGEKKIREISQSIIVKEAIRYAQADTALSVDRTVRMVETAFDIIRDFYRSQIDRDWFLLLPRLKIQLFLAMSSRWLFRQGK